jgi:hypothetical protein
MKRIVVVAMALVVLSLAMTGQSLADTRQKDTGEAPYREDEWRPGMEQWLVTPLSYGPDVFAVAPVTIGFVYWNDEQVGVVLQVADRDSDAWNWLPGFAGDFEEGWEVTINGDTFTFYDSSEFERIYHARTSHIVVPYTWDVAVVGWPPTVTLSWRGVFVEQWTWTRWHGPQPRG